MLSRPRKPPPKRLLPSLSLRFTHHVKLRHIFWKTRSRNRRSRAPPRRAGGGRRLRRVALEPVLDDVVEELPRPEEARVRLTDGALLTLAERRRDVARVEGIRLADAVREDPVDLAAGGRPAGFSV